MGGRIVQLLTRKPLCKKVVMVTCRKTDAFADPKVHEVVVNMDRLEGLRRTPRESTSRSPRSASAKGSAKITEEGCARSKSLTASLLPRRQAWRRSCVRSHDPNGYGPEARRRTRRSSARRRRLSSPSGSASGFSHYEQTG